MTDCRARLRTTHADPETVAAALRPDDAPSMTTRAVDGAVVTEIARDRTGGLRSTVDDYLVNLRVAERTVGAADALASGTAGPADTDADDEQADEQAPDASDTPDTPDT